MAIISRSLCLAALVTLLSVAGALADEPLRVYSSGAAGAMVYVTPQDAIGQEASSSSDIGIGAFAGKFLRGKTPLQVDLKPGLYMVSVMPTAHYSMRDVLLKAGEFVWDGYDYHAIVDLGNTRWRYAHCYLIEKVKGFPAEVLAVFTDQMPDGQALSFDLGKQTTRFTGGEEAAEDLLDQAQLPPAHVDAVIRGVMAGQKMLVREGAGRWAITADEPEHLRIITGHGNGAWAGHRLSVCSGQDNVF